MKFIICFNIRFAFKPKTSSSNTLDTIEFRSKFLKMENHTPKPTFLSSSMFVINFVFPRIFGLLPMQYDMTLLKLTRSNFWHLYCLIISSVFAFVYPFALVHIINNRPENSDNGIAQVVEKLHYCTTYIMAISVYVRQIFFTRTLSNFINNGIGFYSRVENAFPNQKIRFSEFIVPYISRAIYSYVGYTFMNYLTLTYFYGDLKNVNCFYIALYFLPDIVITSTAIRFHSTIIMQTLTMRRLNAAFSDCIKCLNRRNERSSNERKKNLAKVYAKFNKITIFHDQIWTFRSTADHLFSNIVLCAIINAFMNLTCVVSILIFSHSLPF